MDIYVLDLMGSNCTFMELKLSVERELTVGSLVLIVPLWN